MALMLIFLSTGDIVRSILELEKHGTIGGSIMNTINVALKCGKTFEHKNARRRLLSLPFWLVIVEHDEHGHKMVHWYQRREVCHWSKQVKDHSH